MNRHEHISYLTLTYHTAFNHPATKPLSHSAIQPWLSKGVGGCEAGHTLGRPNAHRRGGGGTRSRSPRRKRFKANGTIGAVSVVAFIIFPFIAF